MERNVQIHDVRSFNFSHVQVEDIIQGTIDCRPLGENDRELVVSRNGEIIETLVGGYSGMLKEHYICRYQYNGSVKSRTLLKITSPSDDEFDELELKMAEGGL